MRSPLFRQSALDRLSSPDRLDELIQVTSARGWLALLTICAVLIMVLAWSILGRLPITLSGQGYLLRAGGVESIEAPVAGQVQEILTQVNDLVESDQVLVRITQPDQARRDVRSGQTVRVLELRASVGDFVTPGAPLLSLERADAPLEAVLYLAPAEARRVQPGMPVQIHPAATRSGEAGLLLGRVSDVGAFPATISGMRRVLGSDELAQALASGGPPVEVRVEIDQDPASLPRSGSPCSASVIVDSQSPLALIFSKRLS